MLQITQLWPSPLKTNQIRWLTLHVTHNVYSALVLHFTHNVYPGLVLGTENLFLRSEGEIKYRLLE